jgi:hypothetical protein
MKQLLLKITRDTLQKKIDNEYKWSRTSLTMFTAWLIVIYMVFFDLYKEGFRYDVFATMCGISLGTKLTDSIGKRVEKNKGNEIG